MGIETALMVGSMAASAGSSIIGGIGQQQQYQAQADAARYQAQVARNNQLIAEQNARYASAAGAGNAQQQDFATKAALGRATAAYGAAGVDPTTGSTSEVKSSILQAGRMKSLEEMQKAAVESYGYRTKATDFGAEAGLQTAKAASAESAGSTAMFGSILGGISSVGDKWLRFKNVGLV